MAEVSGPQFGKVLKNTLGGGDSINVVTGNRPTRGFMVSDEGSETRVRAEDMSVDKITRHVDKHAGTLRTDPEAHLGTWRDARYSEAGKMVPSPNDTVYMDVSRRHDSPFMAYNAGLRENQLAIYDVSAQDTIPIRHDLTRRAQRRMSPHVERGMQLVAWDGVVNGQKFNTDEWERWQQGECGTYAAGLKTLNPKLKVAAANFGEHFFAHDGKHAYDSAGKHPMPYRGVSGKEHWAVEKNVDLGDYGEGHGEAPKADIFMAMKHATRHNILGGQWPRKIG